MAESFDPGLTQKYTGKIGRVINPDGTFNVRRTGHWWHKLHVYQWLISILWPGFIGLVLAAYALLNLIFAQVYLLIGVEHLKGASVATAFDRFFSAYFFSFQTFTTVGYGAMAPDNVAASAVAAVEALTGILSFALITGIFYGRFTRPTSKIIFSRNALVAPYNDGISLQIRVVNQRANHLIEVESNAILMVVDKSSPALKRTYYSLALEVPRINFLALTWTMVHVINEKSPLWQRTLGDLADAESEILIQIKAYDETYGAHVHTRYSYRADELVWGARFLPAFSVDDEGKIIVELEKLHDHTPVAMPGLIG